MSKVCVNCKKEKRESDFYGKRNSCKECKINYSKIYREKNPEIRLKNDRKWRENNQSKIEQYTKEYRKKNPLSQKNNNLKRYGVSLEWYNQKFFDQNGVCAICGEKQTVGDYLYVDHSHESGEVRGLLCHRCNFGLGHFKDNQDILLKAVEYLNKYGS